MEKLAEELAGEVRPGECILLTGGLGAGKSVFARAFLRALGVEGDIPSPSFIVDAEYETESSTVHHVDLYRLGGGAEELEAFGILDLLDSESISVIEWADRLPAGISVSGFRIALEFTGDPDVREVTVERIDLAGDGDIAQTGFGSGGCGR
ncbi:MAG TPA: tRNA (adenosine(37)-N6)-threonylcarbamoyltransferase complex ATPase subunit type 1 TsaE [Candidatus Fermentibacter daniensis]|nr:tRNA (adenosine(37)-N6)-threonylcarbamoyltransferase complex ATPase subunit type 1 TsaE [Candidatus Fermentibacter daniensis]HOG55552.1 tRNA (adenosine(37)-N6)-threonylcarbamoyltransferase complex ATPase subunit type 1 TsaE [Candidatus Fermentibacter daniensis]HQH92862.1 tRNA (adenosine(37)-N6)-threonylcarbamoyltransferase complex ATPase subunit type 1 TsaE [Candidatus Fermentibacter daniensis]